MVAGDRRSAEADIAAREQTSTEAAAGAGVEIDLVVVADRAVVDIQLTRRERSAAEAIRARIRRIAGHDAVAQLQARGSVATVALRQLPRPADRLAKDHGRAATMMSPPGTIMASAAVGNVVSTVAVAVIEATPS